MSELYDIPLQTLTGQDTTLGEHRGQVLLIVNTASACGLTPQYEGLQKLHETYAERGLVVLGFPCNQFGEQEPGSHEEIATFCQKNYGVSFPMFAKIEVNGEGTHPLYQALKSAKPGLLGSEKIKWNFTKFLVNREGEVVDRFAPTTAPDKLTKAIEKLL